jgi:hypothetical protein
VTKTAISTVDYDVHGLVGISLVGAPEPLVRRVDRALYPFRTRLTREPDIVVRCNESFPEHQIYRIDRSVGFDEEHVIIFDPETGRRAIVPFEQIGGRRCEISCEVGISDVPLLRDLISVAATKRGLVPVHASAFIHRGTGILIAGFPECGKTGVLLSFAAHGAEYVGDECILLGPDGTMHGIPFPIEVSHDHWAAVPQLRHRVPIGTSCQWFILKNIIRLSRTCRMASISKVLHRLDQRVRTAQLPAQLFGSLGPMVGRAHLVFLAMKNLVGTTECISSPNADMAIRLVIASTCIYNDISRLYTAWRFAYPQKRNVFIDGLFERQCMLAIQALHSARTYILDYSSPLHWQELAAAISDCSDPVQRPAKYNATPTQPVYEVAR